MATPELTPQEEQVAKALPAGRPKRHLQVIAFMTVAALFLGMALYKGLTGAGGGPKVADRPGAKASDQVPSAMQLKEILQKQAEAPASKAGQGNDPSAGAGAGQPSAPTPAAFPPPAPMPPPMPQPSVQRGAGVPPLDLGRNLPPEGGVPSDSVDAQKVAEASYMTAKTEVYVMSSGHAGILARPSRGNGVPADGDEAVAAIMKQLNASRGVAGQDPLARLSDPSQLLKMGGGSRTSEDRIASRTREQEGFTAASRPAKEPLRSSAVPPEPFVAEGTLIPAVLIRAISTNLPGQVEARVTSDVYDSLGRHRLMIPKGSRLLGVYNSNVAFGQERAQVAFSRIIFPSGASITLENGAATDLAGNAGAPGEVNNHFFRVFGSALAIGFLSYAVERQVAKDATRQGSQNALTVVTGNNTTPGTVAAQTFSNVATNVLDRNLSLGPTITVAAGAVIHVQVARDLAIDPRSVM